MTREEEDRHIMKIFERVAIALERIASAIDSKTGVLSMRDVDRAKVYSEHLGKKLGG